MEKKYSSPYKFEGKLPLKQAIPLGLQHVLAMFVGNLTPILIISHTLAFPLAPRNLTSVGLTAEWVVFSGGKRIRASKIGNTMIDIAPKEVDRVVSLSEAVSDNVPSVSSIKKQSRIGNEFLELITRLIACK